MRPLWVSNSPWSGTGYGVQTSLVTPRIQGAGHEIAVACNWGLQAGILTWPGPRDTIPLYPAGLSDHSVDVVANHATHHKADVIITHYDAWVYHDAARGFSAPWMPWFPIDCDDVPTSVLTVTSQAHHRVTQTRHGQQAMEAHGLQCAYVPASYDPETYHPVDGTKWREAMGIDDRYVVVMVAANKGTPQAPSRKSFTQAFQAFKWFLEDRPDAILYLHTMSSGHLNLEALAAEYQITESVRFAHSYFLWTGLYPPAEMAMIYSAADVVLNPSMGEGFGVPILEAQACGTPVITGDWTAMSEVTRTGHKIPKDRAVRFHIQGYGGDMFIVQPEAVHEALVESITWKHAPADVAERVSEYQADTVFAEHWLPVLKDVEAIAHPEPAPLLNRHAHLQPQQGVDESGMVSEHSKAYLKMPKVTLTRQGSTNGHVNKRALLSYATGSHLELLDIALPSYATFAERHGYDLLIGSLDTPCDRPASWHKVPMIRKALTKYDEVLWLDADMVVIDPTDDVDVPEDAWQGMVPHRNHTGEVPNCAVWLLRKPMIPLLMQMWRMTQYTTHGWWEQAAMLVLLGYEFETLPSRRAYESQLYTKTHFLDSGWNVHRWCEAPEHARIMHATMHPDRVAVMQEWAEQAAAALVA